MSNEPPKFIGHLFLRQKPDGSQRTIFNLKPLNLYVPYRHFKMENLEVVKTLIQPADWLAKLDLKDAYLSVPINQHDQKFLTFWIEKEIYQ